MEIIHGLENVSREPETTLSVGSFDGLHLGHQRIIKRMHSTGGPVTVLTFDPHPQSVVRPDSKAPPLLTSFDERVVLFEKLGVEKLIITKFDKKFARFSPEEFVKKVLIDTIGIAHIFVGPHHGFGHGRKGNTDLLRELGQKLGFKVEVVDAVMRFNEIISSSRIRKALMAADALIAWRCLGRPFYLRGTVIKGDGRGQKFGFPTANLRIDQPGKLIPPTGVYCTVTEINGVRYPSVSHFGERPTFKNAATAIETHVIGYSDDMYGKQVDLGMIDRLRDVVAFTSAQDLVRQLLIDRASAKRRLAELGFSDDARMRIQRYGKIIS